MTAGPPRRALAVQAWAAAFAVALLFDAAVATWLRETGIGRHVKLAWWADVLEAPGEFWFVAAAGTIVALVHRHRWRAGAFVLLAAVLSGVNGAAKWAVGRTRPYKLSDPSGDPLLAPFALEPFRGGVEGILDSRNLCFPSGHATLAFAGAAAMTVFFPRLRWVFYAMAVACGVERVLENAHWLSDTVAAAALGVGGVAVLRHATEAVQRHAVGRSPARPRESVRRGNPGLAGASGAVTGPA
ncbi:MAG TPA: phosphatase PAP2 family protein [Tepidisphaeraceae bacterium]|nr:phosphatase PAP2 family protein [Tepidisphaeraceae bacterium]